MSIPLFEYIGFVSALKYRNTIVILIYMSLIFILVGCSTISGTPKSPLDFTKTNDSEIESGEDLINKYSQQFSEQAIIDVPSPAKRNELISKALTIIDYRYSEFINGTETERKTKEMTADFVELSMNLAGAAVGSAGTKTILAAISAGVNGINGSIDKNYYYEKTYPSLVAQMNADRKAELVVIMNGMTTTKLEDYTWPQAVNDLIRYYNAGTLFSAISSIQKQAGVKEDQANDEIKAIRIGKYSKDATGDLLYDFWKPDGKNIDKSNETKILNWMKQNRLATGPGDIVMFLRTKEFSELRQKAVNELLP